MRSGGIRCGFHLATALLVLLVGLPAAAAGQAQTVLTRQIELADSTGATLCTEHEPSTGSPEGVITGAPCDTYRQTDGAAGLVLWVKDGGTGTDNTGWVNPSASATAVDTTGTPVDNQVAIFTDANTVEGDPDLAFDGSQLGIGGSLSTDITEGVFVDQGALDDWVLAFASSDVAHGATLIAETGTWFGIQKSNANAGGAQFFAIRDGDAANSQAYVFSGYLGEDVDTTKSTGGRAITEFRAAQLSGTDQADMVADGNGFGWRVRTASAFLTAMLLDVEGDLWLGRNLTSNGTIRQQGGNGQTTDMLDNAAEETGLTGATVTFTGLIPAARFYAGVTCRVTTTITGATTFDIGDGSDVDRWGAAIILPAGTTTTIADYTATGFGQAAVAQNVVLTANGADFTAGAVRCVGHTISLGAPTS